MLACRHGAKLWSHSQFKVSKISENLSSRESILFVNHGKTLDLDSTNHCTAKLVRLQSLRATIRLKMLDTYRVSINRANHYIIRTIIKEEGVLYDILIHDNEVFFKQTPKDDHCTG